MIAGPVQCRAPSSPTVTATGMAPTGRRFGRSNSSPSTRCTAPVSGARSKACVVTASSCSARVSASSRTAGSMQSGTSSSTGRGQAAVQCAPIPPTFVDMAAFGMAVRADEHRAGPGRRAAGQRSGAGGQLGQQAVALLGVGDVLDVPAGRVAQGPPRLEDDDPQAGLEVGQLAGDRRPHGAGAHDQDVAVGGHRATAGSASSRRLSMSCWARIWSKAL